MVESTFKTGTAFHALALSGMLALAALPARAVNLVGMGDSIGEGVSAADAAWQTQVFSYIAWVGYQMGAGAKLPLIQTTLFGAVGDVTGRNRLSPAMIPTNVAVSGATVHSLLNDRSAAATPDQAASETDLVLMPRQQTQIEYAESVAPELILCWIGNNDALGAATSFSQLDASQLTPLASFDKDYVELADRLKALIAGGSKVVFANLPDVTKIGFLVNRSDAESFLGFPVNLPDGDFTTIVAMLLMGIAGNDNLISDPNFVLDSSEVASVNARIAQFNQVIQREADRLGMPVVDVHGIFDNLVATPPNILGFTLRNRFLGGLFSLDGVHPSTVGHALLANEFIRTIDSAFNMNVPLIDDSTIVYLFLLDPHIDKDGDHQVTGRFGVGLLETLGLLYGITGDPNDFSAAPTVLPQIAAAPSSGATDSDWAALLSAALKGVR